MQSLYNVNGNPPPSYPIYKRLFNFIDDVLLDFNVKNKNIDGSLVTSEDKITEDLTDFLENKQEELKQDSNTSFRFTYQSQHKTDIGVKLGRGYNENNRKPFCWIEAKRLPTPKRSDRDKREYVIVDKKKSGNGGIQRFKEGKHASELVYSIMIGYLQENDANYWLSEINGWITGLVNENIELWSIDDCLTKHTSDKCDRFISIHTRKTETPITLHHYWIKL
jgi:hypothetical protein